MKGQPVNEWPQQEAEMIPLNPDCTICIARRSYYKANDNRKKLRRKTKDIPALNDNRQLPDNRA